MRWWFRKLVCRWRKHRDHEGYDLRENRLEYLPDAYLAANPKAPKRIAVTRCSSCEAVVEGMSPDDIVKMKVSPWA
jgi:hypothetical protein